MSRRGWVLFAAMSLLWGVPYLLIKVAVRDLDPVLLVAARSAIGAVVLLPVALARGAIVPALRHWRILLAFTAVEVAVPWVLLSDGERRVSSSFAGLLIAAVPLLGVLLARLAGDRERVGPARATGLLLGLAGVAALLGLDVGGGTDLVGALEVLATALGYAAGALIIARRLSEIPSVGVIAVALTTTTLVLAAPAALAWPDSTPPGEVLGSVALLGLFCTALAFLLFFALIAEVGAARATVITYVNPAVAVALGITVLSEPVTLGTAIGFPLVLLGSWLATRPSPPPTAVETVPVDPGLEPAPADL